MFATFLYIMQHGSVETVFLDINVDIIIIRNMFENTKLSSRPNSIELYKTVQG